MNTPLMCAPNRQEKASPYETRKRPKKSPRRAFSAAVRAFLTLAVATCAFGAAASAQTISIAPPANSFPSNTATSVEGNVGQTNFDFTISISQPPTAGETRTVNFAIGNQTGDTATPSVTGAGADFANGIGQVFLNGVATTSNTVTFTSGGPTSYTLSVPVTGDTSFEANETFSVVLQGPSAGATIGNGTATATIVNDDQQPSISVGDAPAVPEGNNGRVPANFVVRLSQPAGQDVTFRYNTVTFDGLNAGDGNNGTADFEPQNNQVGVISAGASQTTIQVPVIGDTDDEADGMFYLEISDVSGAVVADNQGAAIIIDDDGPTVSVVGRTASESEGVIVFRIQLSAPSPQRVTVNYSTASNSAVAGLDYGTAGVRQEVTGSYDFEPFTGDPSTGVSFVDIPINIINDNISEPTEIFSFNIVSVSSTATIGTRTATGTITDDDGAPNLTITGPATVAEGNSGTSQANFQVTLSNPSSQTTTFQYQTVPGTATPGQDFTSITTRVGSIAPGQTTFPISVNVVGDTADEDDETFSVRIFGAGPSGTTIDGGTEQTADTIIIDDDGPIISVRPNTPVKEGDNGRVTNANFTVVLNTTSPQTVTVRYALGSSDTNEAIRGVDYNSATASDVLTFTPGITQQTIPVTVLGDNVKEANETITLTLSAPTGGSLGTATGSIIITDDDLLPNINITGPGTLSEGSSNGITNFVFSVALDRASSSDVTVNYTVNDGTAVAGSDFRDATAANPIRFAPGNIGPIRITVPVIADRLNEDDETFSVSLSNEDQGRVGTRSATAIIRNDDALPALTIRDNTGDLETGPPPPQGGQQGPRVSQFTVTLNAPSGKDVTFNYQTIGAAQGNTYTALSGIDFQPASQRVTIPAGQLSPTEPVSVTIISDSLDEENETYGVVLSGVTNAVVSRGGATGVINDDDNVPNVKIEAPVDTATAIEPYAIAPGQAPTRGRNGVFPVTLSTASGRVVTVRYFISSGNNPGATNADFLVSANDNNRIFQSGTLVFTPNNGTTPLVQNIIVFPRGDDGDEQAAENYVVNIEPVNANIAAVADGRATSTVQDRDPSFTNFSPSVGFESYSGVDGTVFTITGNQFVTDDTRRVAAVRFTGANNIGLDVTDLDVNDGTITGRLPSGAFSSFISLVLTSGRILNSTAAGSRRLFYAQPVVTNFSPSAGVPAVTEVTINGRHFRDPRNPVTGVLFNGLATTAQNADRGYTIVSDTEIRAFVPRGATSGSITIRTQFGGAGPGSVDSFTVNGFNTGGIRLVSTDLSPIYENATAGIANGSIITPVKLFNVQLNPATQNNGNNTPINPRRSVDVTVTLSSPINRVLPGIALVPRPGASRVEVGIVRSSSNSITFRVPAGYNVNNPIPVAVTYAGEDAAPPIQGLLNGPEDENGITLPIAGSGTTMTFRAEITATADAELYPLNQFEQVQFERRDIHAFATETGTALRTTEDQNSPNNRTNFRLDLANLDFPNPDPFTPNARPITVPINTDARPIADVTVTLTTSRPDEGLITYYVLVNGQKVYPSGANPQTDKPVIYALNPNRPEYYRNPHFIEVVGQDDQLADNDQTYRITATSSISRDPEYSINLNLPFDLVNTDNEQRAGGAGFAFSKLRLNTDENGQEDFFTAALRTQPAGDVTVNFQSTRVDEVLFIDPNNPTGPGVDNINITFLRTGVGNGRTSTFFRTPISIRVRGVDDADRDGDQEVLITSSIVTSGDPAYGSIDPPDLIASNRDNESNGITVFPTTLTVNENTTSTFTVRLNARPTSNVVITLTSSNTGVATIEGSNTLTFTPANFSTAQTVTVRGVPDGGFAQQRTANIITSAASSGDINFNGLDVADVGVTVFNTDSAFVVNAATTGLRTSESGLNDVFTVSLGQVPTDNVQLILSVNPASEARLSRTSANAAPSLTLTFTPANYANPQTVNVIGQDDTIADGDKTFTIIGRVVTNDAGYAQQSFAALSGINADNESGAGGGGGNASSPTFAANSTYTFSTPFGPTSAAVSNTPISSLFTQTANDFKIYRFDASAQRNSRLIGDDLQLVPNTGAVARGVGYILQTGATPLTLRTPTAVQPFTGNGYTFALTRNKNFVNQTGQSNTNNGLNFIGFPFNPAQFGGVNFATARVSADGSTYGSIREAAAAGVISDKLYTMNNRGQLVEVSGNQVLRPYGAYFIRIYRDSATITFVSPTVN